MINSGQYLNENRITTPPRNPFWLDYPHQCGKDIRASQFSMQRTFSENPVSISALISVFKVFGYFVSHIPGKFSVRHILLHLFQLKITKIYVIGWNMHVKVRCKFCIDQKWQLYSRVNKNATIIIIDLLIYCSHLWGRAYFFYFMERNCPYERRYTLRHHELIPCGNLFLH